LPKALLFDSLSLGSIMRQFTLSLAFAGCSLFASPLLAAQDYMDNSADIVKAANWAEMETVQMELIEHEFDPKHLKLRANKPYRLVIKNTGEADHYYTATEFFKSVAWRKVMSSRPHGGEIKAPYFSAIEVFKKVGSVELFFVPVKKGVFEVDCTIDDHKEKGMSGTITVE
jgi:uncharacterized cupredoxin-like copper-binding protein